MPKCDVIGVLAGVFALCGPMISPAAADCLVERDDGSSQSIFKTHLSTGCSEAERESRAIDASDVLAALKQGRAIDVSGVVIRGDLVLDTLPINANPPVIDGVITRQDKEVRVVAGGVSIVNTIVRGTITHQSAQGLLLFTGPVMFAGTTFEQLVDLSRSVFTEPVTLSGAVFLRESYFVQGRFLRELTCEKTAFGPHTRFHRSQFRGQVTFQQSGFSGLAEFLEVEFERDVNLSRTYFKLGTGFSGSRFHGMADFSEALFDREAFFPFVIFEGDAYFRRATFRSIADFSNTEFQGRDDFAKALFERGPEFAGVKRTGREKNPLGLESQKVQYAITLSLLVFSALLVVYLIKLK
jgi:Pentapeptide repeats (9 copies)